MTDRLNCFGSVLLYSENSEHYCIKCSWQADCKVKVEETKGKIRDLVEANKVSSGAKMFRTRRTVKAMTAKPTVAAVAAAASVVKARSTLTPPVGTEKLPKKAQERIAVWIRRGVVTESIDKGINPFEGQSGFAVENAFIEAYLQNGSRPMTRLEMLNAMRTKLLKDDGSCWEDASLTSNRGIMNAAFSHYGFKILHD